MPLLLVRTWPVAGGYGHVQQPQIDAQLRPVVDDLADGHSNHAPAVGIPEDGVAVAQHPALAEAGGVFLQELRPAVHEAFLENGQDFLCAVHLGWFESAHIEVKFVNVEGHRNPSRQLGDVRGEVAHLHAFGMWLPVQFVSGDAGQHFAGG
jgi:hypothetical protein